MKTNKNNKRVKYGSLAVALTLAVLAVTIAANMIFTALSEKNQWYADMTKEKLFTISDEADGFFSAVSDVNISIVFFTNPEDMEANEVQNYVYSYAKQLEKRYDYITVEYIDSITNPGAVDRFRQSEATDIKTTDVVITNGTEYRVYNVEKFYTYDSETESVFAFNGELRFAAAVMQLSYDNMKVCYTTQHGETMKTDSAFYELLTDCGFDVEAIDLTREDIPTEAKILLINDPRYDFYGAYDDVNEIKKIDEFLDNMGNLMVFVSPGNAKNLTNLNELLSEWGIAFENAQIKDYSQSVSIDGLSLVSEYPSEGSGASLLKEISSLENPPKTIVQNASPISILWEHKGYIDASPVLLSSKDAESYVLGNESNINSDGSYNLVTISSRLTILEDNEKYYNYVLAAGTSAFTDDKYLTGNSYGNRDILLTALRSLGREQIPVDLDFKVFDDQSMVVTTAEANTWMIMFAAILPTAILITGAAVYIVRKNRS